MNVFKVFIVTLIIALTGFFFSLNKTVQNVDFNTLNGETLSLEKWREKLVIVTFWATDCESCLKEIPIWQNLYKRYHTQGLEILGVAMYYQPPNLVVDFTKKNALPYLITLDINGKFANAFNGVKVTPTTFLLDTKGKIVWQKVGLFELSELELQIKTLLEKK